MKTEKTTWDILSSIDCSTHTEKKNGLTYLSWAWAWGITKKNFASANYEITMWNDKPYLFDADLGYLIQTTVCIDGEKITMQLPVMDGANKAQKNVEYTYQTKSGEKTVNVATMFDINTAIMRCLVKNLAMFGLGHYIYAGEDLPQDFKSVAEIDAQAEVLLAMQKKVNAAKSLDELSIIWTENVALQSETPFRIMLNNAKLVFEKEQAKILK
jgi:hypothetical protein